jgi:hypothetical protein
VNFVGKATDATDDPRAVELAVIKVVYDFRIKLYEFMG